MGARDLQEERAMSYPKYMLALFWALVAVLIISYLLLPEQSPPSEAQRLFNQHLGR